MPVGMAPGIDGSGGGGSTPIADPCRISPLLSTSDNLCIMPDGGWEPVNLPFVPAEDEFLKRVNEINSKLSQRFTDLYQHSKNNDFEVGFLIGKENGEFKEAENSHKEGTQGSPMIFLDATIKDPGATLEGEFHTHPGSNNFGGVEGLGFSGEDIFYLSLNYKTNLKTGFVSVIESGKARYALIITDVTKARSIMTRLNYKVNRDKYNTRLENHGNNGPDAYKTTIIEVLGSSDICGIQFYIATDSDKKNFQKIN